MGEVLTQRQMEDGERMSACLTTSLRCTGLGLCGTLLLRRVQQQRMYDQQQRMYDRGRGNFNLPRDQLAMRWFGSMRRAAVWPNSAATGVKPKERMSACVTISFRCTGLGRCGELQLGEFVNQRKIKDGEMMLACLTISLRCAGLGLCGTYSLAKFRSRVRSRKRRF